MAKANEHLAGFDSENTGGVLAGFLADEEHLDRRAMLRLGTWGAASVGAVVVALLANQSSLRSRHDELAAADLTRQAQQIQSVAREGQNEARRLASAIDTLNGDRDRLYSRLTTLEQGLDSVTGTIAKQSAAAAAPPAAAAPTTAKPDASPSAVPATSAPLPVAESAEPALAPAPEAATNPEPAPSIGAVATTTAVITGKQAAEAKRRERSYAKMAAALPAPSTTTTATMPLVAAKSMMGPPDPAATKLTEPEPPAKPAAAPASDKASAEASPPALPQQLAVNHTEFGVDIGGANSVGGLRALWRGLLKSKSNAPLATLQPIIVVKESNNGLGMQLRLVAGPLTDAAAAARICANMVDSERSCATTVYDGQHLAMKADDASGSTGTLSSRNSSEKPSSETPASETPASEKSAEKPVPPKPVSGRQSSHRHSYPKRTAAEEPAKKPESTVSRLSSFFSH